MQQQERVVFHVPVGQERPRLSPKGRAVVFVQGGVNSEIPSKSVRVVEGSESGLAYARNGELENLGDRQ